MKKVDLLIFDFDGTLVETGTDLVQAINFMLKNFTPARADDNGNYQLCGKWN